MTALSHSTILKNASALTCLYLLLLIGLITYDWYVDNVDQTELRIVKYKDKQAYEACSEKAFNAGMLARSIGYHSRALDECIKNYTEYRVLQIPMPSFTETLHIQLLKHTPIWAYIVLLTANYLLIASIILFKSEAHLGYKRISIILSVILSLVGSFLIFALIDESTPISGAIFLTLITAIYIYAFVTLIVLSSWQLYKWVKVGFD